MLSLMNERLEAVVSGKVHGVAFRDFACRKADVLKLTGEVQNLPDGTVRVIAEGQRMELESLLAELKHGPIFARVENVAVTWKPSTNEYSSFSITHN